MITIGQFNPLIVSEIMPFGFLLRSENEQVTQQVVLKDTQCELNIDDAVNAFVYTDSNGQLHATLQQPKILNNQFVGLVVLAESEYGYFFDWGIKPDLYAPKSQVHSGLNIGSTYVCKLISDKNQKLVATSKIERFLNNDKCSLSSGDKVDLLIYAETPLGFKAIIDEQFQGLLFKSDLITKLSVGDRIDGFIKSIRADGKIDLSLQKQNATARKSLEQEILDDLDAHGGLSTLTDKSAPDDIFVRFKVSKGAYKKALGKLYKEKKITIQNNSIQAVATKK